MGTSKLGVEMLNQSQLSDGKKFKCVGSHIVGPELGASCVVQISESGLPCPGLGSTHLPLFQEHLLQEGLGKKSQDVVVNQVLFLPFFCFVSPSFQTLKMLHQPSWFSSKLVST